MFLVTEVQVLETGQVATVTVAFENRREATARYHQILASASLSGLPCHSAVMFTEEGYLIQSDYFRTDPEPEKQEEPAEKVPAEEVPAEEETPAEEEETPEEDYHDPEPSQNESKEESDSETMEAEAET